MPSADGSWLHASSLRWPASIVRNRRHVANHAHFNSCRCESSNRGLASRPGTTYPDVHRAHPVIARLIGRVHCRLLGGKRSSLSGTAETKRARALPRHHFTFVVGNRDDGVVE